MMMLQLRLHMVSFAVPGMILLVDPLRVLRPPLLILTNCWLVLHDPLHALHALRSGVRCGLSGINTRCPLWHRLRLHRPSLDLPHVSSVTGFVIAIDIGFLLQVFSVLS